MTRSARQDRVEAARALALGESFLPERGGAQARIGRHGRDVEEDEREPEWKRKQRLAEIFGYLTWAFGISAGFVFVAGWSVAALRSRQVAPQ